MRRIAISQRLAFNNHNVLQEVVDSVWGDFCSRCEIVPVYIPAMYDFGKLDFDGLILTGGGDLFDISNRPEDKIRDELENKLISYCLDSNMQILGVCRGMQMVNKYFDGTLKKVKEHIGEHVLSDGRKVNSYHNYAIDRLGKGLEIVATSYDSVIEEIRYKDKIFAQMHHPERRMSKYDVSFIKGFFDVR